MVKYCKTCGADKPIGEFVPSKNSKDGVRGLCKECHNGYYRKRRIEKYEQVRSYEKKFHYERRLKYQYNVTKEEIERIREEQCNKCAICGVNSKLVIDHCHNHGHVRGLLCTNCNTGLGHFKDNIASLSNAIEYLRNSTP